MLHLINDLGVNGGDESVPFYEENVTTEKQLESLRDWAGRGYNYIICLGSQFGNDEDTVAAEFPDVQFVNQGGDIATAPNNAAINISGAHLGYGYGYLSALATKTGKVAMIGCFQGSQAYTDECAGFIEGAKACNPDTQVSIVYVQDANDEQEAREAAKLLQEEGNDVIFGDIYGGYNGIFQFCKEQGIMTFVRNDANIEEYPEGSISHIDNNWALKHEDMMRKYLTEGLQGGVIEVGFGTAVRGWDYVYDAEHEFNPDIITDEMIAEFDENVRNKFTPENPYVHNFVTEDANPGVY